MAPRMLLVCVLFFALCYALTASGQELPVAAGVQPPTVRVGQMDGGARKLLRTLAQYGTEPDIKTVVTDQTSSDNSGGGAPPNLSAPEGTVADPYSPPPAPPAPAPAAAPGGESG